MSPVVGAMPSSLALHKKGKLRSGGVWTSYVAGSVVYHVHLKTRSVRPEVVTDMPAAITYRLEVGLLVHQCEQLRGHLHALSLFGTEALLQILRCLFRVFQFVLRQTKERKMLLTKTLAGDGMVFRGRSCF